MGINIYSKQRGTQLGNIELKKQIEKYYSVYKTVPQGGTNWHGPNLKQALCYEVLHLMEENGYRFVTATGSTNDRKWFEPTHRDIVEKIANDFGNLTKRKENPPSGLIGGKKEFPVKLFDMIKEGETNEFAGVCRWSHDGRRIVLSPNHPKLGTLLGQHF